MHAVAGRCTKVSRNINMERLRNNYLFPEVCGFQTSLILVSSDVDSSLALVGLMFLCFSLILFSFFKLSPSSIFIIAGRDLQKT